METKEMTSKTVEVNDLDSIVLTNNGTVVGYITIKTVGGGGDVEFLGRAVNLENYPNVTYHGFSCGISITTKNIIDTCNDYYFLKALNA